MKIKSGHEITDQEMLEFLTSGIRANSLKEISELTSFPINPETAKELADSYVETVNDDPAIRARKREIGNFLAEADWIGTIQTTDGMKRLLSFFPKMSFSFVNKESRNAYPFTLTEDKILIGEGEESGKTYSLLDFCSRNPGVKLPVTRNGNRVIIMGIKILKGYKKIRFEITE